MKDKATAAILAVFLGGIGVHRFYLGQTVLGIFYLFFFWTLIPGLIAFIDFICFLVMSQQTFDAKYNQNAIFYNSFYTRAEDIKNHSNTAEEIQKLYSLKEKGILTNQEYEKEKSKRLRN